MKTPIKKSAIGSFKTPELQNKTDCEKKIIITKMSSFPLKNGLKAL